jgi:HK97 family phage major capsid protein/HK97 family phage prohead protease
MEFILSDETPDRLGDIISATGWDLENFKKNPIALFNHHSDFPIGKWANLRVDKGALRGHLQLAPAGTSPRIDEIRKLIDAGILKAVSVGFRALESEPLQKGNPFGGERYLKQELVETSLVSVPANPNALSVAKSLNISSATLDIVFAKPGSKQGDSARRRRNHRQARHDPSRFERRAMNGNSPLGQRIQASQQRLVRYQDQLTEHLKNVNDENVSDADMATTQELNARIAQEDKTLATLQEAEARLAVASVGPEHIEARNVMLYQNGGGGGGEGTLAVAHPRPFAIPAKKVRPQDYMWRALTLQVIHHHEQHKRPILEILKEHYGEDEATRTVMNLVTRNASVPATIVAPGWAAELVTQVWTDFIEALLPFSVFPEIARRGQSFTFGRNGVINLPMRNQTPQIAGSFVGEGAPIPVRQGAFATVQLTPKKMAVISTFTRELAEHSTPAIEGLIREAITNDTAISLDSVLLDQNAATAVRPPGLLNGTTGLTPTAGGGINALIGDIKLLIDALNVSTLGNLRDPVWLMSPSLVAAAALTPTTVGILPFREEIARGTLMSFPIVKSASVPAGTMILLDCADFASVTEAAPRFDVSDQAVLHMEDTAPLAIIGGTTGTPVPAVPTRSLWQTDTIGVRMLLPMNWAYRRPGMVQWMSGVTWA